jgi:hypothetical protein
LQKSAFQEEGVAGSRVSTEMSNMPNNNPHGHNQYTKRNESGGSRSHGSGGGSSHRGFAGMDPETRREMAKKGGESHGKESHSSGSGRESRGSSR